VKMRAAVVFACLIGLTAVAALPKLADGEYQWLFSNWVAQHNKIYQHDDFHYRFRVFKHNLDVIRHHNSLNKTWTMAANKFTDMTKAEFLATHTGLLPIHAKPVHHRKPHRPAAPVQPIDWTTHSPPVVTPVKDQAQCGSCWAFSATGSVESAWALSGQTLVSLSEQQLVDCSGPQGDQGCNGGLMDNAFQYIITQKGICSEDAYPYTATDGQCKDTTCTSVAHISAFTDVTQGDEDALYTALKKQPVSVAVDASSWQSYSGGVMTDCTFQQLDHGVLLVGADTDETAGDYWRVKNSWGTGWGESGFIRVTKGSNQCGISNAASTPSV